MSGEARSERVPAKTSKLHVYMLPKSAEAFSVAWCRVRDEGDKITMSVKENGNEETISDQKEICLTVEDFSDAEMFLQALGCTFKAYQESKREVWKLDGVEICIDEWPWLEPFV